MNRKLNPKLRRAFTIGLSLLILMSYTTVVAAYTPLQINLNGTDVTLPLPDLSSAPTKKATAPTMTIELQPQISKLLEAEIAAKKAAIRQEKIDRVEAYFREYGSPLAGYGHIFVDQSAACDGDYRVLVGIAGSESGLGRAMYKKYNPFGYLNGVQYPDLETALRELSCKVSRQHISVCKTDLNCLYERYAGPQDDPELFKNKVRFFMNQV